LPPERKAQVLPYIREWVAPAAHYSAAEVFRGQAQIAALRDAAVDAGQRFDFVLSPVSPVPAFAAELASPVHDPARPFEHIAFTLPYNMSEQPALSVPCGFTADGLPIGLQISGRRFDDLGVLQLGAAWERLRPAGLAWNAPALR
jgi:aspartyl-tRNA(Asn)/glutamyl-tRNA(Gln) amidotransferase subunit A